MQRLRVSELSLSKRLYNRIRLSRLMHCDTRKYPIVRTDKCVLFRKVFVINVHYSLKYRRKHPVEQLGGAIEN